MGCIAVVNRQRLMPRPSGEGDRVHAVRQLERNSLVEAGLGLLILGIVAVLGRIPPHVHDG
jgi:putative copper export protein